MELGSRYPTSQMDRYSRILIIATALSAYPCVGSYARSAPKRIYLNWHCGLQIGQSILSRGQRTHLPLCSKISVVLTASAVRISTAFSGDVNVPLSKLESAVGFNGNKVFVPAHSLLSVAKQPASDTFSRRLRRLVLEGMGQAGCASSRADKLFRLVQREWQSRGKPSSARRYAAVATAALLERKLTPGLWSALQHRPLAARPSAIDRFFSHAATTLSQLDVFGKRWKAYRYCRLFATAFWSTSWRRGETREQEGRANRVTILHMEKLRKACPRAYSSSMYNVLWLGKQACKVQRRLPNALTRDLGSK